jgi:predicted dehydrogenase/threonine dehydrogenase-like Zn-dependent dehydrogenase
VKQVINKKGSISVGEVPEPPCGAGEVKIALTHSLISAGTETYTLQQTGQNLVSRAKDRPDLVKKVVDRVKQQGILAAYRAVQEKVNELKPMGYSASGIVLEAGPGVQRFSPGDRVACGGQTANHASIVRVPENLVVHIPEGVESKHAAFATLGAIAMQGVRRAHIELGDNVVVLGLGLVGQLAVQFAKAAGAHVIGFDLSAQRVELAKTLGADAAYALSEIDAVERVDDFTRGVGADAVIVAAATKSSQPINDAIAMARERGRISILGIIGLEMQHNAFYMKELDVYMSRSYGPGRYDSNYEEQGLDYPIAFVRWTENRNMTEVLRLIADGRLALEPLISRVYPVTEAEKAYAELQAEGEKPLGVLLEYPNAPAKQTIAPASEKPLPRAASKSVLNVALIGCGGFAKKERLPYLKSLPTFKLEMLVSQRGTTVKQLSELHGVKKTSCDYRDALADPEIDLVVIATPNSTHAQIAIDAASAGKAVLVEKPMAIDEEELARVNEAVNAAGIPFACGFNRRFAPASAALRRFCEEKSEPKVILYRCNAGLIRPGHPMHPEKEGGGLVVGEACHFFDYCTWLIGSQPVSISASTVSYDGQHFVATDNLSSIVKYADGSTATIVYTTVGYSSLEKERIEVFAGGGSAVLDDFTRVSLHGHEGKDWSGSQDKGHRAMMAAIGDALTKGNPMPIGLAASSLSHQLTFEAKNAARNGAVALF